MGRSTGAGLAVVALGVATCVSRAAIMSFSQTPPPVNGADIAWLGTPNNQDKWWADPATTYGNPGRTVGQTFTTGSEPVYLRAFTFQIQGATQPEKVYTIRVGRVSGTTFTPIATEMATQTVATAANDYWTWTLATPVLLEPNTEYGVDVGLNSSTSDWTTGIPYVYYNSADVYPGGRRFRSGTAGYGIGNNTLYNVGGDRVFHIDLTVVPTPAYWDCNGSEPGAGGEAPTGTWAAATPNWNRQPDGTGPTDSWEAWGLGSTAVFAAGTDATGTYTVTVDGIQTIGGLTFEEGTVTLASGVGGELWLVADTTMDVAAGLTATVATPIYDNGTPWALTKVGSGTLILSAGNGYSGATTIRAGTLRLGADGALPDVYVSDLTLSGDAPGDVPTLDLNGHSGIVKNLFLGGPIPGTGAAVTTGAGILMLGGDVTYNPYGVNLLGATISGQIDLGLTRTFIVHDSKTAPADLTVSADIFGFGCGLIKEGAGTLVLSGNNAAATGGLTVNAGVVQFESPVSINGSARDMTVNAGGVVVFGPSFDANDVAAALSQRVVADSAGTIAADYQQTTDFDFNAAGLAAASLGAVGTVLYTGTLTPYGMTYRLGGGGGTLILNNANAVTGSGKSLLVIGPGTVVLAQANDYDGTTTISSGTLQIGNGGTTGSLNPSSPIVTDGTLVFNRSDTVTQGTDFAGGISGSGGVVQAGGGTLILNSVNTYTGPTAVRAGTLRLTDLSAVAASSSVILADGARLELRANGSDTFNTPPIEVEPGASATIDVNNDGSGTGNTLIVSGGLVSRFSVTAPATVNITGGNGYALYSPMADVNTGGGSPKLRINPTTASIHIGTFGSWAPAGQRSTIYLSGTSAGNLVDAIPPGRGPAWVELVKEGTSTWTVGNYCTPAQPQGAVTILDGVLTVTGTLSSSEGVRLNGGQLNYDSPGAVRGLLVINGGNLDNTSGAAITESTYNPAQTWGSDFSFVGSQGTNSDLNLGTGPVTLSGTRTVTIQHPETTLTIGGAIVGAGASDGLIKDGPGTLQLLGRNTYTGPTLVQADTLKLSTLGSISSPVTVASGGAFGVRVGSEGGYLTVSELALQDNSTVLIDYGSPVPSPEVPPLQVTNLSVGASLGVRIAADSETAFSSGRAYALMAWQSGPDDQSAALAFSRLVLPPGIEGRLSVLDGVLYLEVGGVLPPPRPEWSAAALTMSPEGVPTFRIGTVPGYKYRLLYSDDVTKPLSAWQPVTPPADGWVLATGPSLTLTDLTAVGQPQRFYVLEAANP